MRKIWEKIKKDCKGAVTVIVTLLLIPAVLISGTGVDLTRAYAAKSIAQDANQLAANSMLASYDAMLQDLYGLFGMMQKDEAFKDMVENYVDVALNGDGQEKGLGTFQLFYGSGVTVGNPEPAKNKNLADPQVLRRQIEEYAKYRAPVIIVEEVIKALDAFDKIQKDAKVVKQKMDIDEKVEEIDKLYKQIYECINEVNKVGDYENKVYEKINEECIDKIQDELKRMSGAREDYITYFDNGDMEMADDYLKKFEGCAENISALLNGGTRKLNWENGYIDDNGDFQSGKWTDSEQVDGSINILKNAKETLTNCISGEYYSLKTLRDLCAKAENKKSELKQMVDNLEAELNKGECSEELRKGMMDKDPETQKSTLDTYRDLLKYDLNALASAMITKDEPQIQDNIRQLEDLGYGDYSVGDAFYYHLDGDSLHVAVRNCTGNDGFYGQTEGVTKGDALRRITYGVDPLHFKTVGTFVLFQNAGKENNDFYSLLQELYASSKGNDKKAYDGALKALIGNVQKALKDIFLYEPEGAYKFQNASASKVSDDTSDDSNFTEDKDWGEDPGAINDAMSDSILTRIGDGLEAAANKVLLLTYDSEMFSCYATGKGAESKGEDGQKIPEINMNGIPLGIDVNYYYQSEMEYLFHGDRADAIANLKAVAGLIFLVRFVFNYVASFSIPSVKDSVIAVKSALSGLGPFAVVAGELVRLALALAESAMDVGRLKGGSKVALYKQGDHGVDTDNGWRFSILSIIKSGAGAIKKATITITEESDDDRNGMGYKDYMRLFLLLIDGDVLADRTAKLIEMNVTNKKQGIGGKGDRAAREAAMTAAEMFKMSEAVTDFSLTTTLDLRMIFLSMPFAQKGVNGKVPPGTLQIAVTDYRGY